MPVPSFSAWKAKSDDSEDLYAFSTLPHAESHVPLLGQDGEDKSQDLSPTTTTTTPRSRQSRVLLLALFTTFLGFIVVVSCLSIFGGRPASKATTAAAAAAAHAAVEVDVTAAVPLGELSEKDLLQASLHRMVPYDRTDAASSTTPSIIWQTWKSKPEDRGFPMKLHDQVETWTKKNPTHVHLVVDDPQANDLIKSLYSRVPSVYEAYTSMALNVHRADFFRYLILFAMGGTYSDVDTKALRSIKDWLPQDKMPEGDVGFVVGLEADLDSPEWSKWYARRVQMCQWTIRSKAGHPILGSIIAKITLDTLSMKAKGQNTPTTMTKSTMEYTGPGIFTDTIFEYLNDPRYYTARDRSENAPMLLGESVTWKDLTGLRAPKLLGDVVFLPITSFSPDKKSMGGEGQDSPLAFVKHDFQGSWKGQEKVKGSGVNRRRLR